MQSLFIFSRVIKSERAEKEKIICGGDSDGIFLWMPRGVKNLFGEINGVDIDFVLLFSDAASNGVFGFWCGLSLLL